MLTRESPTAQLSALATSRSVGGGPFAILGYPVLFRCRWAGRTGSIPWRIVVLNPHIATEDVPAGRPFSKAY